MKEIIDCSWAVVGAAPAPLFFTSSLLFEEVVNSFYRKGEGLDFAQRISFTGLLFYF